ncbi:MAG: DUF423 domain-containing protein [Bacteroidetes bacterium]|nr:DUF423 domain-containing protein [Bacteroidota bacterium]
MRNATLSLGALLAGITIAMGALGAHALKDILNAAQLQTYETAVRYQMYHVFALLLLGILQNQYPQLTLSICKKLVLVGMVLFGGSIYLVLFLTHVAVPIPFWIYLITPLGGLCYISSWLLLAAKLYRISQKVEN